jgi:hypothetical protein
MPMPPYAVLCYTPGCGRPAAYKIAAEWSDGLTRELKTYGLCCAECVPAWFARARERKGACRAAPGETLGEAHVFRIQRGQCDQRLERMTELESELISR